MDALKLFFIIALTGLALEFFVFSILDKVVGKPMKTHHKYSLGKNVSIMSVPIIAVIFLLLYEHYNYVQLFIMSAIIGTVAEYVFGRFVHHVEGKRAWTYHYGVLGGYTSYFSIPYWGGAGMLFVLIARFIGL